MENTLSEAIKTGIPTLDKQYEEFLELSNKINLELENEDETWAIFISIENYIHNHFPEEEKYMKASKYDDYKQHKSFHAKFIEEYKEISGEITSYESVDTILPSLKTFIDKWVENHYNDADKKFASFLKGSKE